MVYEWGRLGTMSVGQKLQGDLTRRSVVDRKSAVSTRDDEGAMVFSGIWCVFCALWQM